MIAGATNPRFVTLSEVAAGDLRICQRGGDADVWLALKRGYSADDYGLTIDSLGDCEWALTSVVNDDSDARGIGGPAVLLQALQEGATVPDCFAVGSEKCTNGFPPRFYGKFGFEVVGGVAFNPEYYDAGRLEAAKAYWAAGKWDGELPPVKVI